MEKFITFGILGFTLIISSCTVIQNSQDNSAIKNIVDNGASPLAAACAIRPTNISNLCLTIGSKN